MVEAAVPIQERKIDRQNIADRFRTAWELYQQSIEPAAGVNITGVVRLFLKSVFRPEAFDRNDYTSAVDKQLVHKLQMPLIPNNCVVTDDMLKEGEQELVEQILRHKPVLVENAQQTINALAASGDLTIWTVGDYLRSRHTLPDELIGSEKGELKGSGHQLWKLWSAGLANREDVDVCVADNKLAEVMRQVYTKEGNGVSHFVFFDDSFENLEAVKRIVDEENLIRSAMNEDELRVDVVLVNQGRKAVKEPPKFSQDGSLVRYHVINSFGQATETVKELTGNKDKKEVAIFCDFDGVVTNNTQVRSEWDVMAVSAVDKLVEKGTLHNPQKDKLNTISSDDLRWAKVEGFVAEARKRGLRIGVKNGAYDLLHPGHVVGFTNAKDSCDVLIVLLNSDASIREYKGVKTHVARPIDIEEDRAAVLLGLEAVDAVVVFEEANPAKMLELIKPDVYISSKEYENSQAAEFQAARQLGIEVVYTDVQAGLSTSHKVETVIRGFLNAVGNHSPEAEHAAVLLRQIAGI